MSSINSSVAKVHATIAAFFLPIGLLFLLTGALDMADTDGGYKKATYTLPLVPAKGANQQVLMAIVTDFLTHRGITTPGGEATLAHKRSGLELHWKGLNKKLKLKLNQSNDTAVLTLKTPDWNKRFMQIHKASAGESFKAYTMLSTIALLVLMITGLLMAWRSEALRGPVMASMFSGALVFGLIMYVNIVG